MRLALHTDFSLRVLLYLASLNDDERATTPELAEKFQVSPHHLQKVVQTLAKLGLVHSTAGRNGGIEMAQPASVIRLGWLIRELESFGNLVDCSVGPCPLAPACTLKGLLQEAEQAFFDSLDKHTLADAMSDKGMVNVLLYMKRA